MPVSPIEESESLSQSGETEEADENMDDRRSRAVILENYGSLGEECRARGEELRMKEKNEGRAEVSNEDAAEE